MKYQDYVIRDGEFIGNFEKMYQDISDPWHQTTMVEISYFRCNTIASIKRFHLKNVLEVGCGLGHFTNYLASCCKDTRINGMDISKTAIQKAREKWAGLNFFVGNLKNLDSILHQDRYDGVIFAEILWYSLEFLGTIKCTLHEYLSSGGGTCSESGVL